MRPDWYYLDDQHRATPTTPSGALLKAISQTEMHRELTIHHPRHNNPWRTIIAGTNSGIEILNEEGERVVYFSHGQTQQLANWLTGPLGVPRRNKLAELILTIGHPLQ